MYGDVSKLRTHPAKTMLNDDEWALIDAVVRYTGEQRQPLLRQMILQQAQLILHGEADFTPFSQVSEGLQARFKSA